MIPVNTTDTPSDLPRKNTPGPAVRFLRLYVAGFTPRSRSAIEAMRTLLDDHLDGSYHLEVIDICQQPEFARQARILATPALVKCDPSCGSLQKIVLTGDLTQADKILAGLG